MTFVDTTGMEAGMHLNFKTAAGRDVEGTGGEVVAVYVVSITDATTASVVALP